MMPTLSFDYISQNGNGIVGVGWTVSGLPAIARCPRTWAQDGVVGAVNYDSNDRFCMDGQRLVAVSGNYGADGTQYRTEVETFSRVISHGAAGSGPAWFEVKTKAGQTMEFGNTADSRVLVQGFATAKSWALDKVSDTKGNYFAVSYTNDATNGLTYPTRIDYTGNAAAGVTPYNSVQFVYATRPDTTRLYQAGSLLQIVNRLTNVRTYVGTALVSDYRLAYQQSGPTSRSRMTSVTACDVNGVCLPPTSITWTDTTQGFASPPAWSSCFVPSCGWTDDNTYPRHVQDVNGDGRPDIVGFATGGVFVALNTGTSFAAAQVWNAGFGNPGWNDDNVNPRMLVDVNGDGLPDVVGFASTGVYVALNTGTSFGAMQQWNTGYGTTSGWSDNNVYPRTVVDVNGDGLPDVLGFASTGVYVSLNGGTSFGVPQLWYSGFGAAGGWSDDYTYPRRLVDVNGDGLPDIVGFSSIGVMVALNTGTSFAAATVWNTGFNWSGDDRIYPRTLADVNGDGLPDVVGFASLGVYVSLNTGTSFGPLELWYSGFGTSGGWANNNDNPRVLSDVNGDGLADIVGFANAGVMVSLSTGNGFAAAQYWSASFGSGGGWTNNSTYPRIMADVLGTGFPGVVGFGSNYVIVAANLAGVAPDLVSTISPGLGAATTVVSYVPTTNTTVVTKGAGTAFPLFDLMQPLYVVSRLDKSNGVGGYYSSSYTYSGGRLDVRGRGFLGFAQTVVKDLQTNISDSTTYRQDFPYIGLVSSATRTIGTQTLGQSTNTYQFTNTLGGTAISPGSAPYRVSLSQNVSTGFDLDGSALPVVTTANQYDAYNNATQVAVSTPDGFSKTTTNTYTNDITNWYLGRLTRASVTSVAP